MSGVDQAAPGGTTTARGASPTAVPLAGATAPAGARGGREAYDSGRRWEFLYFAVRNKKLLLGLGVEIIFVLAAIIGPYFAPYPAKMPCSKA